MLGEERRVDKEEKLKCLSPCSTFSNRPRNYKSFNRIAQLVLSNDSYLKKLRLFYENVKIFRK